MTDPDAPPLWLNGVPVDATTAGISPLDRGFTLGDGLFETMRARDGEVFRLGAHLERLTAGAARIGLPLPDNLELTVRRAAETSGFPDAAVRLTVSRGPGAQGLVLPAEPRPTVVVAVRPYAPAPEWFTHGIRAITATGRLNEHAASAGLKQLGYLDAVLAQREADAAGVEDALRLDTAGHLAEGAASNLFLLRGGVLHTPPLSCGVLPGITRAVVLELAAAAWVPTNTAPVAPEMLCDADEAFLTSSLRGIASLVEIDRRPVGVGRPGPLTIRLRAAYLELVRTETSSGPVRSGRAPNP